MDIQIRRAVSDDVESLTTLAHDAKRHWGYSEELIALWSRELTFTPEYVARHAVYVASVKDRAVGVYALVRTDRECELEHLWVRPAFLGRGVGRALVNHAIATARAWNVTSIKIVADPNAEGFYDRLGAIRVGDVPSRPRGRRLPLLRLNLC